MGERNGKDLRFCKTKCKKYCLIRRIAKLSIGNCTAICVDCDYNRIIKHAEANKRKNGVFHRKKQFH